MEMATGDPVPGRGHAATVILVSARLSAVQTASSQEAAARVFPEQIAPRLPSTRCAASGCVGREPVWRGNARGRVARFGCADISVSTAFGASCKTNINERLRYAETAVPQPSGCPR
jgi:hypothetical protein